MALPASDWLASGTLQAGAGAIGYAELCSASIELPRLPQRASGLRQAPRLSLVVRQLAPDPHEQRWICLYDGDGDGPPLHADLKFVSLPDVTNRVDDLAVMWERDGWVTLALQAEEARFPSPDPQWIADRFWVWIHDTPVMANVINLRR